MNNEEKKEQLDDVQKNLVSVCFKQCFDLKTFELNESCRKNCYENFILTLRDVTHVLEEEGYYNHSLYAYKAFPRDDYFFRLIYKKGGILVLKKRKLLGTDLLSSNKM